MVAMQLNMEDIIGTRVRKKWKENIDSKKKLSSPIYEKKYKRCHKS